jgi:hypothetical protein
VARNPHYNAPRFKPIRVLKAGKKLIVEMKSQKLKIYCHSEMLIVTDTGGKSHWQRSCLARVLLDSGDQKSYITKDRYGNKW